MVLFISIKLKNRKNTSQESSCVRTGCMLQLEVLSKLWETTELGDTRLNECTNERVFISFYIEFQELCSTQLRINFNYLKIVKTQIMQ